MIECKKKSKVLLTAIIFFSSVLTSASEQPSPLQLTEESSTPRQKKELTNNLQSINRTDLDLDKTSPVKNDYLEQAIREKDLEKVQKLLLSGININKRNSKGNMPLHEASIRGHLEIVDLLLTAGADVNARDSFGSISLKNALENQHIDVFLKLLETTNFSTLDNELKRSMLEELIEKSRANSAWRSPMEKYEAASGIESEDSLLLSRDQLLKNELCQLKKFPQFIIFSSLSVLLLSGDRGQLFQEFMEQSPEHFIFGTLAFIYNYYMFDKALSLLYSPICPEPEPTHGFDAKSFSGENTKSLSELDLFCRVLFNYLFFTLYTFEEFR